VEIRFDDRGDFARLAGRFKAAGRDGAAIRRALTATIQKQLKTVVSDIQSEARGMTVKGVGGRGSVRRAQYDEALEQRRRARAQAAGRAYRARRGSTATGLRARIAQATKSRVQYTGRRIGAKIYIDGAMFPPSQRRLPRLLNNPAGWRHPVWGHKDRKWARQVGEPYFDRPIHRHRDRVRREVGLAVDKVMRTLR
jgi:hypothetical protein